MMARWLFQLYVFTIVFLFAYIVAIPLFFKHVMQIHNWLWSFI